MSFSFDLWSSKNKLALPDLCAHIISDRGQQKIALLAVPRQYGRHTGPATAETLGAILAEFGREERLGDFITDNASNNESALDCLVCDGF